MLKSLANNNIGYEGLEAISNMLLDNDSITQLDLTGNNLGDEDASNIIKIMDVSVEERRIMIINDYCDENYS